MSQQSTPASNQSIFARFVGLFLPAYLIGNLVLRVITVAHEYPMRTEQVLIMSIDGLAIVGLFGAKKRMPAWLFWAALVAGLLLFAIRLNGDASWWTGHLMYSLSPR